MLFRSRDAIRRAWARTFAFDAPDADPVHTEPEAFANDLPAAGLDFVGGRSTSGMTIATPDGLPPQPQPDNLRSKSGPLKMQGAPNGSIEPVPALPAEPQ